jgi:photosystem II stability/assembly factor-like uncharacterized protein
LNTGLLPHVTVTALALDPGNTQRLYVGTAGAAGVWISEDGGSSGHFAAGPLSGRVAYALLADPAQPESVIAGTDAGLYWSADAGQTWQPEMSVSTAAIYGLARDADGAIFAGGVGPAVYYDPAGQDANWRALASPPGGTAVLSIAASPRGNLLLAGTDGAGLFLSRDGGHTWGSVPEIGRTFVAALAFVGAAGRVALARTRLGLYITTDGAQSWQPVMGDLVGRVDALAAGGQGDLYLGTSEGTLYHRAVGSETWQRWGTGIGVSGMFLTLMITPENPSRWYAGTAGGLYLSDDGGLTWRLAQPGPGHAAATSLAVAADGALYLGNDDGVLRSTDGGQHWEPRRSGLPADTVSALAPAAGNGDGHGPPGLIYAGLAGRGLYRSTDGGLHWEATGWTKRGVPALLVDPADANHLFIRVAYERVYESRDGGQTWAARWDGLGLATQIISLAMDSRRPGVLYAGGSEGFFRSLDGAANWQSVGPDLAGQTVFAIALDPLGGPDLYAGATNGAYRSQDGGEHWEPWGRGLENVTVTALAFAGQDARLVFAGTKYQGVFRSLDGGQNWQYAGPAPVSVNGLVVGPDDQWVFAATAAGFYRETVRKR